MHEDEEFESNMDTRYTSTAVNLNTVLDTRDLFKCTDGTLGPCIKYLSIEANSFLQSYHVQCDHQEVHSSMAKYSQFEADPWVPYL